MSVRTSPWCAILFTVLLLAAAPARADEVRLANGDRLSGTAVRLSDGVLVFETGYAGEVEIEWPAVRSLRIDGPATFLLHDGREEGQAARLRGSADSPEDGRLRIDAESVEEPATVALADVVAINPVEEPPVRVEGYINAGFQDRSGNSETRDLHLDAEAVARTVKNRYTVGGSMDESESDGEETSSRSELYAEYDHFLSEHWFLNSNARFTEDEFKDLELRSSFGVGAGYQVWDTPRHSLAVEAGVSLVNEDLIGAPDEEFTAGRWAVDFDYGLVRGEDKDRVHLFHRHEALLSVEDGDDYVLLTQTGLRFLLLAHLNATLEYAFDYDASPAPGREEEERRLSLSLGYAW